MIGGIDLDRGDKCALLALLFPGEEIRLAIENRINRSFKILFFLLFPIFPSQRVKRGRIFVPEKTGVFLSSHEINDSTEVC